MLTALLGIALVGVLAFALGTIIVTEVVRD
jgi:hypothetical protein